MATGLRSAVGRFEDSALVVGTKRPDAGGGWRMSYRDSRVPNLERPEHLRRECAEGPGPGVLAYVDGEVAGWCSIAPRSTYRRLMRPRTIPFLDERNAWRTVCFVVRPGFRGQGLMHTLLAGAVEHAAAQDQRSSIAPASFRACGESPRQAWCPAARLAVAESKSSHPAAGQTRLEAPGCARPRGHRETRRTEET
jgi:GNAT superfamily N-acetyltransferase